VFQNDAIVISRKLDDLRSEQAENRLARIARNAGRSQQRPVTPGRLTTALARFRSAVDSPRIELTPALPEIRDYPYRP
jgi:hypothetical protein